jgi:hypothetical protein
MNIQTANREGGAAIDTRKTMGASIGSFVWTDPPIFLNHIPPGDGEHAAGEREDLTAP